jgi:hypothetical protein
MKTDANDASSEVCTFCEDFLLVWAIQSSLMLFHAQGSARENKPFADASKQAVIKRLYYHYRCAFMIIDWATVGIERLVEIVLKLYSVTIIDLSLREYCKCQVYFLLTWLYFEDRFDGLLI